MEEELILLTLMMLGSVAGFVDTLAGGGGLISLSALFVFGINPIVALATNKLQGVFGLFTASCKIIKHGLCPKNAPVMALIAFLFSVFGTVALFYVELSTIKTLIPVAIFFVIIFYLGFDIRRIKKNAILSSAQYNMFFTPLISFYDGFFGPGTGTFFSVSSVLMEGKNIIQATAQAKILNFATNFGAVVVFAFSSYTFNYKYAAVMIIGQVIGANFASKFIIRENVQLIKYVAVFSSVAVIVKSLFF